LAFGVADSVGAYTLTRFTGPLVVLRQSAMSCSELLLPDYYTQETIPHCKANSVHFWLIRTPSLPAKCVVLFL